MQQQQQQQMQQQQQRRQEPAAEQQRQQQQQMQASQASAEQSAQNNAKEHQQKQYYGNQATPPGSAQEVDTLNAQGLAQIGQGNVQGAIATLKKAVELDTTAYYAHANLAVALAKAGNHADAVEDFNFAMGLAPDCALALYGGAESLVAAGHPERAFDYYAAGARAMRGYPPRELPTKENLAPCAACDAIAKTLETGTPFKLSHDAEQVKYLISRGILPGTFSKISDMHNDAAQRIRSLPLAAHGVDVSKLLGSDFNRMYHVRIPSAVVGDAVTKNLAPVMQGAGSAVYDNVLSPEALEEVLAFTRESHIYHIGRNGFVAGNAQGGFGSDALLRIAQELRTAMPDTFGKHTLVDMVIHKHEARWSASDVRAEEAAHVAVMWITPDAANMDPSGGGLVIHGQADCGADCDAEFNNNQGRSDMFLKQTGNSGTTVPYKQNRMIVVPGGVAYSSQPCNFSPKYEDMRTRVSLLFGRRK